MAGARPHPFRITLITAALFGLGLWLGTAVGQGALRHGMPAAAWTARLGRAGNTVMARRMQAITRAMQRGADAYEFEIVGFSPVLGTAQ